MVPKGKGGRVKLKLSVSFPQYILSASGKKGKPITAMTTSRVT